MSKDSYNAAFSIMKAQSNIYDAFNEVGLRFEYGDGVLGTSLENILNNSCTIIRNAMGFKTKTFTKEFYISGNIQTVSFDVLYIGEYDEAWAITEDDFSDFVHIAVDSHKMQDMFWQAMINRDENSKTTFNQLSKNFKIGISQYLT